VDWQFRLDQGGHRPISLVFATEKSEAAIKEALLARRTIAWFDNLLVGYQQLLEPLIRASIRIGRATYQGPSAVVSVHVENISDATFILRNQSPYSLHQSSDLISLPPHSVTVIDVKTMEQKLMFDLDFEILNAVHGPNLHPTIQWPVKVDL
jgi:hypothetical protein